MSGFGFHSTGFATTCALNALGGVLAVVLYTSYKRDSARREALHGRPDPDAPVDTSELADKVSVSRDHKRRWRRMLRLRSVHRRLGLGTSHDVTMSTEDEEGGHVLR